MLTHYGGLKDVPNVFIFRLTNHKANLDAAFTRRMTGKLFLGVPSAVTRMTWSTSNHFHISMKLRTLMADFTVNFSGANMKELMEELHMKCLSASASHVTETMLRETVQLVSKSEHVLICGMTPVELAHRSKLASTSYQSTMDNDFECIAKLIASCPSQWTGRIFVSCGVPPRAIHALEGPYVDLQRNDGTVHTMRCQWGCQKPAAIATACARTAADSMLNMTPRYMLKKDNVRTLLMTLSQSLNASFVRIVDAAYFYSDRCSGEASMMHELAEIMCQSREYDRCIVALDMDTVVLSPAVDSNRPLHFSSLLHQMLSIVEDSSRMSEDLSSFLIIVVVSSSESCTQRFKDKLRWPENEACDFALQKSFGLDLAQTLPSLSNPERHQTLCVKGLSNATTATPVWCNACGVPVAALPAVLRSDDPVVVVSDEASINASSASAVSCRVCTECEALVPAGFETLGVAMCPVCVGRNITRGAMDIFEQGCCEFDKQPLYLWWRETAFDELMLQCSEPQSAVLEATYQRLLTTGSGHRETKADHNADHAASDVQEAMRPPVLPWAVCPAGNPLLSFPPRDLWENHDGYLRLVARGCKGRPDEAYRRYELLANVKLGHCDTNSCTSQDPRHFREHVHSLLLAHEE